MTTIRLTVNGSPPLEMDQKQAAAFVIAFLIGTPIGRLAVAAGLIALLLAGFVGHWMA